MLLGSVWRPRGIPWQAPKAGCSPQENEDSAEANSRSGRFAISDGASTAARSEVWSEILTSAFVFERKDPFESTVLSELRTRWWDRVHSDSLPWFAQSKLLEGSAATFLSLTVHNGRFRVTAVGDSCVFHIRGEEIIARGPLDCSADFTRFPALLTTRPDTTAADEEVWSKEGEYHAGDVFILATDAAAKYILRWHEQKNIIPRIPNYGDSPAGFLKQVDHLRNQAWLDNDDTTLCVVET